MNMNDNFALKNKNRLKKVTCNIQVVHVLMFEGDSVILNNNVIGRRRRKLIDARTGSQESVRAGGRDG